MNFILLLLVTFSFNSFSAGKVDSHAYRTYSVNDYVKFPIQDFIKASDISYITNGRDLNININTENIDQLDTKVVVSLMVPKLLENRYSVISMKLKNTVHFKAKTKDVCDVKVLPYRNGKNTMIVSLDVKYPKAISPFEKGLTPSQVELRKKKVHTCIKDSLRRTDSSQSVSLPVSLTLVDNLSSIRVRSN